MPKYVAYELFVVDASSLEAAKEQVETSSTKGAVVVNVAESLGQLFHPVHLAEAQDKFGDIQAQPVSDEPVADAESD